jgi:hypothetical protein
MVTPSPVQIPALPPELTEAVVAEAERDADRVIRFLRSLGLPLDPGSPIELPRDSLLQLGAALRMLDWERSGISPHIDAGLGPAHRALAEAFFPAADRPGQGAHLTRRLLLVFAHRFAWHAGRDWDAAILLDSLDDEAALDEVARFLLAHCKSGSHPGSILARTP